MMAHTVTFCPTFQLDGVNVSDRGDALMRVADAAAGASVTVTLLSGGESSSTV